MKGIVYLILALLLFTSSAVAHEAFTLVSSEKKVVKVSDITQFEKQRTAAKVAGSNLTFTEKEIRLIAVTGPEDDMLSYRIYGVRNPNLVVPAGVTLRILFVNVDSDMRHDIRFGHVVGEFDVAVDTAGTVGTQKLTARGEDGSLQAEEIVIKAVEAGAYKYFCSVRGHAKGGMWGNILVGVKPGADLKTAPKVEHIHSADEDKDHDHAAPADAKKPEPNAPAAEKPMAMPAGHDHGKPAAAKTPEAHDHSSAPGVKAPDGAAPAAHDHGAPAAAGGTDHSEHGTTMRSSINIGEAMSREGSGSSWLPDSSPMYAWMKTYGDGSQLMLHGTMFLRYTSVGGSRDLSASGVGSSRRLDAPSMLMAMYSKPLTNRSQLGLRTMFSLDPIIQRGYGYPLLYQSGELC